MAKRVYWESVKKWWKEIAGTGLGLTGLTIFAFLAASGAIDIIDHSGDMNCAGTPEDPCIAIIEFKAKEDIFIYPIGYDPWGRNTILEFAPEVESWKMYRSWGSGWREIPLDKSCTGTWCGLSNAEDERQFSVAFRKGKTYTVKVEAMKENPNDVIKWAINYEDKEYLDPVWDAPEGAINWSYIYENLSRDIPVIEKQIVDIAAVYTAENDSWSKATQIERPTITRIDKEYYEGERIGIKVEDSEIYGGVNVIDGTLYLWNVPIGDRNYDEFGACLPHEEKKGVCSLIELVDVK